MSSYYSQYDTEVECRSLTDTNFLENNRSLPIVGDSYSFTRTRNPFVSLIMSIKTLGSFLYRYNLLSNSEGSMRELLRSE